MRTCDECGCGFEGLGIVIIQTETRGISSVSYSVETVIRTGTPRLHADNISRVMTLCGKGCALGVANRVLDRLLAIAPAGHLG